MARGRKRIEERHPTILGKLGTMSDTALAKEYGCSNATVGKLRREYEIPRFSPGEQRRANYGTRNGKKSDLVIMVFRIFPSPDLDDTVYMLHSFHGTRVYHIDHIDPRIDPDLPRFHTWGEAQAHLMVEPGGFRPCLLDLEEAKLVFKCSYAPVWDNGDKRAVAATAAEKIHLAAQAGKNCHLSKAETAALTF